MRDLIQLVEGVQQWPGHLRDNREIARFISSIASDYVDEEMIEEYLGRCSADLKLVPIDQLKEGDADVNIPSKAKHKRYMKMTPETMPPLVVVDGTVIDGNHRFRVAKEKGLTEVLCYVVNE